MNLRTKILLANLMLIASLSAMELSVDEDAATKDNRTASNTGTTELNSDEGVDTVKAKTETGEVTVTEEEQDPKPNVDPAAEDEMTPGQGRKETEEQRSYLVTELKKILEISDKDEIELPSIETDDTGLGDFLENKYDKYKTATEGDKKTMRGLLSEIIDITRKQMTQRELPAESEHEIQTLNGNNTSDDNKKSDDQCDEPEQQRPNCMERVAQFLWNPLEGMKHLFWAARQRISGKMKLN